MIVRAAIKYKIYYLDKEVILPLHRHCDGGIILKAFGFTPDDFEIIEQGFLTEKGEFLSREAALFHAIECGQLEEDPEDLAAITSGVLMSEDLW